MKEETKNSFSEVKKDVESVSKWIKHLNEKTNSQNFEISELKGVLSSIENEIEGIKNMLGFLESGVSKQVFKRVFKTPTGVYGKQTAVGGVQTGVQTAFQTAKFLDFRNLSLVERAIVWILLNTEMKLGYEDVAAILGKDRATVRGQINNIKRKNPGLIEEIIEKNGKKRVFIPENTKEKMLKSVKVRVDKGKEKEKNKEKFV